MEKATEEKEVAEGEYSKGKVELYLAQDKAQSASKWVLSNPAGLVAIELCHENFSFRDPEGEAPPTRDKTNRQNNRSTRTGKNES